MIDYFIFGLSIIAFVFVVLSLFFIVKEKRFENKKLKSGINAIVLGLFFLMLFIATNLMNYADKIFHEEIIGFLPSIDIYIDYLIQIANLAFIPLIAIFFLVAMVIFRKLK